MTEKQPTKKIADAAVGARKVVRKLALPNVPSRAYTAKGGAYYTGDSLDLLQSADFKSLHGKVQLLLTSPPYPLNEKKAMAISRARST